MSKEPKYKIIERFGDIEIREYDSFLVAQVEFSGERQEALRAGFRLLADFIFGGNRQKTKMPMRIPVTEQQDEKGHFWKICFMMPQEYTEKTIPEPDNRQIKIVKVKFQRVAVIIFSGTPSDEKLHAKALKLKNFCESKNWQLSESPVFAFYNPPWTLPFLRRNEVMYLLST